MQLKYLHILQKDISMTEDSITELNIHFNCFNKKKEA